MAEDMRALASLVGHAFQGGSQSNRQQSIFVIYLAGALYVVLFLIVCYQVPKIALVLIVALAPFNHDISTGGPLRFSIGEINLILSVVVFLLRGRRILLGPLALPIAAYLSIGILSSALSWRDTSLVSLVQMTIYLVLAVIVFTSFVNDARDFRWALKALIATGMFLACATIKAGGFGYVLGLHKNAVGASLACCVVVAAELWFSSTNARSRTILSGCLLVLVAGLFFSLSRGAWLCAACGLFVLLALRREFGLLLRLCLVMIPVVGLCWAFLPEKGKTYATDYSMENYNIKARFESIDISRANFNKDRVLGVGVGLRKEYDATNVVWLTLAETGVLGLMALLWLHFSLLRMVWKTQRHLHRKDPLFSAAALGAALVSGKFIHGLVDHYWSRGSLLITWAAAGMATHAYFVVRKRLSRLHSLHAAEEIAGGRTLTQST